MSQAKVVLGKENIAIFACIQWVLSLGMKTKVVQNVLKEQD